MSTLSSSSSSSTTNHIQMKSTSKSLQLVGHLTDQANVAAMLSRRYAELLRSEKYADCIFHIEGVNVKCHKLILSSASPVFEAMFYGPIREEQLEIEILDMSLEIFKTLLHYIYAGIIDFEQLTLEQTIELYYGAEKYLLSALISDCLLAITRKLRFANILPALELSVCMNLTGLLEVCMSFFTRCCLRDPQYMAYQKSNYLHISKDCIKTIIAANKQLKKEDLLWFVYEWCQQECNELGLQSSDCALIIDDLQLQADGMKQCMDVNMLSLKPALQQSLCYIERSYYKACRPFTVDYDTHEWKLYIKSNRYISLQGICMHSRLVPNIMCSATAHVTPQAALNFPNEYSESLRIEISKPKLSGAAAVCGSSDGEESDHELEHEQAREQQVDNEVVVWQHDVIAKQHTKYNCDLNLRWDDDSVILSPDVEYQLKLIWHSDAYGAEYPCSLQSNVVDGIQFRDYNAYCGNLIKGLRFLNLV